MLLSRTELLELVRTGVVENCSEELVNQTSIDITLGEYILLEEKTNDRYNNATVSLRDRQALRTRRASIVVEGYRLDPGEFILAQSQQVFNLPNNISAEYKLKSSLARVGLEHMNAGWCDPGWHGSVLTLEFKNMTRYTPLLLRPGDRIGQMIFFKHEPVPDEFSYASKGHYNGDRSVQGAKG